MAVAAQVQGDQEQMTTCRSHVHIQNPANIGNIKRVVEPSKTTQGHVVILLLEAENRIVAQNMKDAEVVVEAVVDHHTEGEYRAADLDPTQDQGIQERELIDHIQEVLCLREDDILEVGKTHVQAAV